MTGTGKGSDIAGLIGQPALMEDVAGLFRKLAEKMIKQTRK